MSERKSFIDPDYVDVAQRRREFFDRFPDGRLGTKQVWALDFEAGAFICVWAQAFRTPDDPAPGDGLAWEPVPGPTSFTKNSELMNAQTAAWGRAILAVGGFESKKIASADEVRNRQPSHDSPPDHATAAEPLPPSIPETLPARATAGQKGELRELLQELYLQDKRAPGSGEQTWTEFALGFAVDQFDGVKTWDHLTKEQFQTVIDYMRPFLKAWQVTA